MTKKIFRSTVAVGLAVLLASLVIIMGALYTYFGHVQEQQLRDELSIAAAAMESGDGEAYLSKLHSDNYRITWLRADGTVLYDTKADAAAMENHAQREEVRQALTNGTGESSRYSATLLEKTLYYARRLPDGTVLRLSASRVTMGVLLLSMLSAILAVIAVALILSGILAATMSTADSQMLAAASSVSQNILQEFGHMKLTEKQSLFAARLTIICISVVGVVLARDPNSSVFGIVSFAWAGFGGAFGAVVLCALFWKRCNWQGALAGMLSGGLMVFVWKYIISPLGGVFGIYELLPAFLMSLLVCVVVSLVTPAPSAEIEAEFDAAK